MPKAKIMRVGLYGRCSTTEEKQDVENQFLALRQTCEQRGWTIVQEYVNYMSGRKGREGRSSFDQMLGDASQRTFDLLYFWRLDRFSSEFHAVFAYHQGIASINCIECHSLPAGERDTSWFPAAVIVPSGATASSLSQPGDGRVHYRIPEVSNT